MVELKYCIYCGKDIPITKMHDKYECVICHIRNWILADMGDILDKYLAPLREVA